MVQEASSPYYSSVLNRIYVLHVLSVLHSHTTTRLCYIAVGPRPPALSDKELGAQLVRSKFGSHLVRKEHSVHLVRDRSVCGRFLHVDLGKIPRLPNSSQITV